MTLNSSFYYPVTLHDGTGSTALLAPTVDDLPISSDSLAVILQHNRGDSLQGLYAYSGRSWVLVLPYYSLCGSIVSGDVIDIYTNISASQPIPTGGSLWVNGIETSSTTMEPGAYVYLVQVPPSSGGGVGAVTSVNSQTGAVTINADNLPGLADVGRTGSYDDLTDTPAPYVLPAASASDLGGVKVGANIAVAGDGTLSVAAPYVLPLATSSVVGGIKAGSGAVVSADGTLTVPQYVLPTASDTTIGGVRVGSGLAIDGSGILSATGTAYTLPAATTSDLGGIKVGTNLTVTLDGTLNASAYTLPTATAAVLGGIRVGSGLAIDGSGVLSNSQIPYSLPVATSTVLGGVKAGSGVTIAADGTLSAVAGVSSVNGKIGNVVVEGGSGITVDNSGANIVANLALTGTLVNAALGYTAYNGAANPSNFLTANQNITVSGDATGNGTNAIALTLANSGVSAGVYKSITVDAKGRVTAGTNPTTLAGYGITNALNTLTGGSVAGNITMTGGSTVTGVAAPVAGADAANKDYVDSQIAAVAQGVSWKQNARAATTANIASMNGPLTIDDVALIPGDRVLVKNQTDRTQNGVYIVMPTANDWVRAPDVDTGDEIRGMAILVVEGTTNALTQWVDTNTGTVTIGTTEITYTMLSGGGTTYTAGTGLTLTGTEFALSNTGVTAGTYGTVTVNAQGRVTAGAVMTDTDVTNALGYTPYNASNPSNYISTNQNITVSGDATGNGTTSIALTLANSGVTASTYRSVTVDAKGRVTAGSNPTTLAGYGITNALANTGGSMSGSITFTSGTVTGLPTPVASSDAVTKAYSDAQLLTASQNAFWKQTVQVASTGNLTQSGLLVIDGYQTVAGDRVLVKDQTNGVQNGIWIASSSAWSRAADSLSAGQILNQVVLVLNGTVGARTQWVNTNTSVTVGSTSLTYAQTNAATLYTAGTGLTLAGNAFSVTNTGVTAGQYTKVTVNAQGQVTTATQLNATDVVSALTYTPVNQSGDTLQGALNFAPLTNVASAATTNIGTAGSNNITVTGTTTITSLGTVVAGAVRNVVFAASLTLTHNATSLILPTGANIVTAAGDAAVFLSLGGGNWRCIAYQRADGTPLVGGADPTKLPLAGGTLSGAVNFAPFVVVTAAATTNLGAAGSNNVNMIGNTTITAFDTIASGAVRNVVFAESPLLTHNSTSLILPTGANIQTAVGDSAWFVSLGSGNWRCLSYTRFGTVPATLSGAETLSNKTLVNPTISNFTEAGNSSTGTTFTVDLSNGTDFEYTTTGNTTITLPAAVAGKSYTVTVKYGGAHSLTFAGGTAIRYSGGNAPVPTAVSGRWDVYVMKCDRAATATMVSDGGRNYL